MHDVIVVGAGPAGAAAAHRLAVQGRDVLLLDKAAFPRDKTCGDAISYRAMKIVEEMGALDGVRKVAQEIRSVRFVAPDGREVASALPRHPEYTGVLVIPRLQLDTLLKDHAVTAGAQLVENAHVDAIQPLAEGVQVSAGENMFRARLVILAVGANSALLRRQDILKEQPQTMLAARGYARGLQSDPHEIIFSYDRMALPAYGWIFPLPEGRANVGAGFFRIGPNKDQMPATARESLDIYMQNPAVQAAFTTGITLDEVKSFPLRVDFLRAPKFAPRTLIAGEAAGLVNPLTGEGIDYALESGRMAADGALAMLAANDFGAARLDEYARSLNRAFARFFRYHAVFRDTLFTYPWLLNRLMALGAHDRQFMDHLLNSALGILDPAKILAPRFLARLAFHP